MIPGLKLSTQSMISGIKVTGSSGHSSGSLTISANQFSITNSIGTVVFRMGMTGHTARETMAAKRSKDQAAPWWKRIIGD